MVVVGELRKKEKITKVEKDKEGLLKEKEGKGIERVEENVEKKDGGRKGRRTLIKEGEGKEKKGEGREGRWWKEE